MPTWPLSSQPIPLPRIAWPYVITAGVNDGSGPSSPALLQFKAGATVIASAAITVPATSDSVNYITPEQFASEFQTLINAALPAGYWVTITVNALGRFVFSFGSPSAAAITSVVLAWSTSGARTQLSYLLGFTGGTDVSAPVVSNLGSITSPYQAQNLWLPTRPVTSDSRPITTYASGVAESLGGTKTVDWGQIERREIQTQYEPAYKIWIGSEGTAHVNEALERLFLASTSTPAGAAFFTYSPDASNPTVDAYRQSGLAGTYSLQEETRQKFSPKRWAPGVAQWSHALKMTATS